MTQEEIKKLASEIVGDGQLPNLWFVTSSPHIRKRTDDCDWDFELISGYDETKDVSTTGPYSSYEDALQCYDDCELDADYGIGQVILEDRLYGTVKEKYLTENMVIRYEEEDIDYSKLFYKQ